jgi:hypothetical protein
MHINIPVGKPEGKIPLGKWGRSWEDNIKLGLKKKYGMRVLTSLILLRTRTSGGFL